MTTVSCEAKIKVVVCGHRKSIPDFSTMIVDSRTGYVEEILQLNNNKPSISNLLGLFIIFS
jgi:hypothetical protein